MKIMSSAGWSIRHLIRNAASVAVFGFLILGGRSGGQIALATTYLVTSTSMADADRDGRCTFPEALKAVNATMAYHECPAPSGNSLDVIKLKAGSTYVVSAGTLPTITQGVTIQSATVNSLVTIKQDPNQAPTNFIFVDFSTKTINTGRLVTFQDIDFLGKGSGSEETTGIYANGSFTQQDQMSFVRCWVENFTGGGIYAQDLSLDIAESAIDNNTSGNDGGGVFMETHDPLSLLYIYNSSITRTKANGGLHLQLANNAFAQISDSTLSDNQGGGIRWAANSGVGATLAIYGSTIAFNTSTETSFAGGITNLSNNGPSYVYVWGSIVADNSSSGGSAVDYAGDLNGVFGSLLGNLTGANIIQRDGQCIFNHASGLNRALKNNRGPEARPPMTHLLLPGSICLDALPDDLDFLDVFAGYTDERLKARGYDYLKGGNAWDMGAAELQKDDPTK
jgi:hypothetical protein